MDNKAIYDTESEEMIEFYRSQAYKALKNLKECLDEETFILAYLSISNITRYVDTMMKKEMAADAERQEAAR